MCHLIRPFLNYDWLQRERTTEEKSEEAESEPCRNDSYFLPSQETPLLEPDFLELHCGCLFIPLIIHSFLERDQVRKKEAVGGEIEVSKPICSIPKLLLTSLFSSILFMMEFQNIESLHVYSFTLFSFCVYCRVHSLA